jgi:cytochrome c
LCRCHAIDKKIVGPAYVDVAAKYKNDKNAVAMLSKKVKEGSTGGLGADPDAAQRDDLPADITELVTRILTRLGCRCAFFP